MATPTRPKHLKPSARLPTLRKDFPKLSKQSHDVTSDWDTDYNCIAFAAGITNKKVFPASRQDYFWPSNLPNVRTPAALEKFYEMYGYKKCADGAYVKGKEKIAIYAKASGEATHAAKQVGDKRWASKLGDAYDIEHDPNAVSGPLYGDVVMYMERNKPQG